jgi:hypothetical protein
VLLRDRNFSGFGIGIGIDVRDSGSGFNSSIFRGAFLSLPARSGTRAGYSGTDCGQCIQQHIQAPIGLAGIDKHRRIVPVVPGLRGWETGEGGRYRVAHHTGFVSGDPEGIGELFALPLADKGKARPDLSLARRFQALDRRLVMGVPESGIPAAEGLVWREASGYEFLNCDSYGDTSSNAEAMALKRAAAKFGVGIGLYDKSDKS